MSKMRTDRTWLTIADISPCAGHKPTTETIDCSVSSREAARYSCLGLVLSLATLLLINSSAVLAQGILTITPGRTASTAAGTGRVGYSGDGGAAASANLALPAAIAYDASGNLFIADANNHVVREVTPSGTITTIAGTGVAGFGGDGGAATSAFLDTPTGLAIATNGSIYIADSHNHRIRRVSGGTISTVAGTGVAGFSGDGNAATSATLNLPSGIALDASGNLYVADTNNQRIRKITGTTINTIAGNGDQVYAGDGGAATAASLDSPTGVAVDAGGNIYIADRHNQRVRVINAGGTISTFAGNGGGFAGGYGGDGSSATAASLAKPTGVSVDATGNVYITDTNNQRVRQVSAGTIASIAGEGDQGFAGDGGPATSAILNAPRAAAPDASGNLAIADTLDQRIRTSTLALLTFASGTVGVPSASQTVTLSNTGSAAITVSSVAYTGGFATVAGGTCSATPITLAPGASCTENIAYTATVPGAVKGSVVFSGTGVAAQTVLLAASSTQSGSSITITSSVAAPFTNQPFTFTATVSPGGPPLPTGTVTFYSNGISLGTATLTNRVATITTSLPAAGTYNITAIYSGDGSYTGSTSAVLNQVVVDFNFTLTSSPGSSNAQTVVPGGAAVYNFTLAPLAGSFSFPITFTATGLPPGATATFSPSTVTLGSSPVSFTMTVQTPASVGALRYLVPTGTAAVALLMLPFAIRVRRKPKLNPLLMLGIGIVSLAAFAGISGCGTGTGFLGQQQQTYTINVVAVATGSSGATLQHVAAVTLTVQ